jgi:hypothetical protein
LPLFLLCMALVNAINSEHTQYMRAQNVPLCDCHHVRMQPEDSSHLSGIVFKCASLNSRGRYYREQYGYFSLVPGPLPGKEQIDTANRCAKICPKKRHARSFMAITRPKNSSPEARGLWCWHCYECDPSK